MAMIGSESVETASLEEGLHLPGGSPHLVFNGSSSSTLSSPNTSSSVKTMDSRERDSARDSGVDISEGLHEPKEDAHLNKPRDNIRLQPLQTSSHLNYSVSENFCINPLINGIQEMHRIDSEDISSMESQSKTYLENSINSTHSGNESEMGFLHSMESEIVSSMNTCSTIFEESSQSSETPSSADTICGENSNASHQSNNSVFHDEIYQPEEELYQPENDGNEMEQNPFDFSMPNSVFNIDKSKVQIGPKYDIALSPTVTKVAPGISISPTPRGAKDRSASVPIVPESSHFVENSTSPSLHVVINTPPVQSHSPITKTQSTPARTLSSVNSRKLRDNPRLDKCQVTHPPTPQMPPSYTPPQGNFNISSSSIVLGPQIIVNSPNCPQIDGSGPVNPNKVLTEAQDKLVLNYKHQTKTSFLPWLKGRQIIPITEFYTESRILAVDKQGKQTRQTVDLVHTLVQEDETRFLVEGEPGMGKTLLAHKLAIDWANKNCLQEFKFVFLIFLRDFKDSLEAHVKEMLLSSLSEEKFKKVWEYCKNNEEQVLFILDGYDELDKSEESKIQKLIESRDFQRSKVVITSRPDVLRITAQRIIVKGFTEAQIFEFIGKYFRLVSEDSFGRNMKRIIEKDYKYRKLAKRPLFCVLLCMLYGSDVVSKLPEKLSDLMFKIMLCLIKWNNEKVRNVDENTEAFPPEYEEQFHNFGKLCVQALKTDKTRFGEKEMSDSTLLVDLGFLFTDSENGILGPIKFYKPVHKIFLEYLAGLYIANHISRDCRDCRECRDFSLIYRHEHVLQFVVGTLDKRAYLALDGRKHQIFLQMNDADLLMLLREAGPTKDNCRAVAKLLDHNFATVYTSEVDFEGWSSILAQNFRKLKSLEIVWRIKSNNPDQESSFTEASPELYAAFFAALRSNTSINKIKIRATQDGEPFSEEKIELFFSNLEMVLPKENLRELEIKELKMPVSTHFRAAIEGATCQMDKKALGDLEILCLDMFMDDEDLHVLCDRLKKCAPNLKELQLTGLVIGSRGFSSLVELLKKSKNLHRLHISMDKAHLQPNNGVFLSKYGNGYSPSAMHTDQKRMIRHAVNESKRAYNERKCSLEAESSFKDSCSQSQDTSNAAAAKICHKGHHPSGAFSVSWEKDHQQLNKVDYYTQEEIDGLLELDEEENTARDQKSSVTSQHLSTKELPRQTEDSSSSSVIKALSKGNRSPRLSDVSENIAHHRSPSGDSGNAYCKHNNPSGTYTDHASLILPAFNDSKRTCNERKSPAKDPHKELGYLFQDPFTPGGKHDYKAKHYYFIPGDGETPLPLPLCNDREHKSVFHDLFSALPESSIRCFTLDYPCLYLSTLDLVCLGDAIRKTKHLETLKLQNLKMAKKYIPVVLGLGQSQSLTTVVLESSGVVITDASFTLACIALRNNTTLKSLSLARWEFSIQDKAVATRYFRNLLSSWKVTDLNLANCHIDIGVGMAIAPTLFMTPLLLPIHGPIRNWSSIKALRLPNVKLKEPLGLERRGHLLLPVLRNCPNLTILDLSAASNHITSLDDKATHKFFQLLGTNFKKLKELTLCNWEFKFKNYEDTCAKIGHLVRSCTELKVLVLDKVSEVRSGLSIRTPCRTTFLHQLVNNFPRLSELSLCCYRIDAFELDRDTAAHLGACFHDHWNSTKIFKLKFFGLPANVETALHDSLKKDNFSVSISPGYPLEITVKKRCFLAT